MALYYCREMQRKIHIKNNGLMDLRPCINCGVWPLCRNRPTKKQAVPSLRGKLSDLPGAAPLTDKLSGLIRRIEPTKGQAVKPTEVIWDEWTHRKESVYTPKFGLSTFKTKYICEFVGKEKESVVE